MYPIDLVCVHRRPGEDRPDPPLPASGRVREPAKSGRSDRYRLDQPPISAIHWKQPGDGEQRLAARARCRRSTTPSRNSPPGRRPRCSACSALLQRGQLRLMACSGRRSRSRPLHGDERPKRTLRPPNEGARQHPRRSSVRDERRLRQAQSARWLPRRRQLVHRAPATGCPSRVRTVLRGEGDVDQVSTPRGCPDQQAVLACPVMPART